MQQLNMRGVVVLGVVLAAMPACAAPEPHQSRVIASHPLPALDGTRLGVTMMEVTYAPGESSAPHSHPCPVVGYVTYGRVRMHVEGSEPAVYEAGESFYEDAGAVHLVSANDSRELPASFLAWFTCDGDAPLAMTVQATTNTENGS
ncbi:MAG: cupin domain-containing protein [Gemmatimonadota bacterium]|nr:cupin domain-containing protein [Gemmatimonadota bacterium]